ncbi:hypothetical protein IGJ48_002646 [Enterococcus pernyi]
MNRKTGEIVVPTEPASRATKITGFTFKSYDKNAGLLQFQIKNQDGRPTDLFGATVRLLMFIYSGDEKKEFPIFDHQIITESYLEGIVKYPIPDMLLSYEGKVDANIYIDFPDGSHTDNLAFSFTIEKSVIDWDIQLNGEYYFKDFQQLLEQVKAESAGVIEELLGDVKEVVDHANEQIVTMNEEVEKLVDKVNEVSQQVENLGRFKRMYSNSINFGKYDYSGNPNLFRNVDSNNWIVGTGVTKGSEENATTFTLSDSTTNPNAYVQTEVPILSPNKKYTMSTKVFLDNPASSNNYLLYRLNKQSGSLSYLHIKLSDLPLNEWIEVETMATKHEISFDSFEITSAWLQLLLNGFTGTIKIKNEIKIEEGESATPYQPNLLVAPFYLSKQVTGERMYKYFGTGIKDSNNPNDYSWDITEEYIERRMSDYIDESEKEQEKLFLTKAEASTSLMDLTTPQTVSALKKFNGGLLSNGINVGIEYAQAVTTDKYNNHGAIYLGGCAWLAWETLTFQKADGYAKGSYIRLGADGNASFTYSDVPNIFGGYLWLGGTCQPDYTDGGFGSYHITVENNFDDARKPIVRFVDSPTTPVKKLAVRGFALVFAPAPTENSRVLK